MEAEVIEYLVKRLIGPENKLAQQLNVLGAARWRLSSVLLLPMSGEGSYVCFFWRVKQD